MTKTVWHIEQETSETYDPRTARETYSSSWVCTNGKTIYRSKHREDIVRLVELLNGAQCETPECDNPVRTSSLCDECAEERLSERDDLYERAGVDQNGRRS